MLTKPQVQQLFTWLRERVKPANQLKVQLGDKEYKAGYLAGYKDAYEAVMICEDKYLAAIGLAERERQRNNQRG